MRSTLSKWSIASVLFVSLFMSASCTSDNGDDPVTPNGNENFFWIHFEGDSAKIMFSSLQTFDADGEDAIRLDQFVSENLIPMFVDKQGTSYDARVLYSYQIVGEDGFSASTNRGYANNTWDHLHLGHVMKDTRQVVFPDEKIDLPGAFNIKDALRIYIHRKFDVTAADSTVFVELRSLTPVMVTNRDNVQEEAIPLKEIISTLLPSPDAHTYSMNALDGFGPSTDMTWMEFQSGYWLLSSKTTMFTDTSLAGGSYKLKVLERLVVKP
jgi:hypothetical protein